MRLPSLGELHAHLNLERTPGVGSPDTYTDRHGDVYGGPEASPYDAELARMLDAAVEVLAALDDFPLVRPALDGPGPEPALFMALMEFVRDMWAGTQVGGAGRQFGQTEYAVTGQPMFSAGRPTVPPYVRGLLEPYRAGTGSSPRSPVFSFPPPPARPLW